MFTSSDYDKIINILNRNPFAHYKEIASQVNCSPTAICKLFKELRQEYNNEEVIEKFLEKNRSNKNPILFIDGILQSICKLEIDQSHSLAAVFEEIGRFHGEMELGKEQEIKYSTIYKYFGALVLNKALPSLDKQQQAIVLSIIFEILNFSEQISIRRPAFFKEFIEKIQTQLAQFLLKVSISPEEWNEVNDKELIKAFNIPQMLTDDSDELKSDPVAANMKLQKSVSLYSLNPFHLSMENIVPFQELVDEIFAEDNETDRNLKMFNDTLGINIDRVPVEANVNNGSKIIVHKKHVQKIPRINSGKPLKTAEEAEIEKQIFEKISKHEIISVDEYKKSFKSDKEPPTKKKKFPG